MSQIQDDSDKALKAHDHKKLGKELDLFTFSDVVGKGLPLWTPKGATIRRILERWVVDEELRDGYLHVYTPDIANLELYKKSGHYPYYKDSMYEPIQIEEVSFEFTNNSTIQGSQSKTEGAFTVNITFSSKNSLKAEAFENNRKIDEIFFADYQTGIKSTTSNPKLEVHSIRSNECIVKIYKLYMLRPMTCPHHFELFLARPYSYKEMPVRFAELAKLYRYEQSGELMGLQRVRSFCLSDAHIIARKDQAAAEINKVLTLIEKLVGALGLSYRKPGDSKGDYYYRLSLGNRADEKKYFKDDASWDQAENVLKTALDARKIAYTEAENEAAFYGPKIDIQMWNANGKEDTAFTVQYDFVMPKRFNLSYINEQGQEEQPIVIHRSSIGAIERLIAFLIEKYEGKFPVWLAPVQVKLIPIADRHVEVAQKAREALQEAGIRVELDGRSESMQAKIRDATLQKIPFMAIIGDKEAQADPVLLSVRSRDGGAQEVISIAQFVEKVRDNIERKTA